MVGQAKWTTTNHTKGCLNPQKVLLCIWGGIRMESTIMSPSEKLGFPCNSAGKQSACNVEDVGSICGLGRSPGEGKGCPLQYSGLENSMNYVSCKKSDTTEWLSYSFSGYSTFVWQIFLSIFWKWKCRTNCSIEEAKLKFYITSCSLQSLDHVGLRKWGLTILGTGAYLTHPCPALCNLPAPANPQTHKPA